MAYVRPSGVRIVCLEARLAKTRQKNLLSLLSVLSCTKRMIASSILLLRTLVHLIATMMIGVSKKNLTVLILYLLDKQRHLDAAYHSSGIHMVHSQCAQVYLPHGTDLFMTALYLYPGLVDLTRTAKVALIHHVYTTVLCRNR